MLIISGLGGGTQRGQVSPRHSDTFMSTGHPRNGDITFSISARPIAGHHVFQVCIPYGLRQCKWTAVSNTYEGP